MEIDPTASRMHLPQRHERAANDRVCAHVVIYPGELSSSIVTDRMGVRPSRSWDRGQQWTTARGTTQTHPTTCWILSTESILSSVDIRDHLDWLLERLSPVRDALISIQSQLGAKMYVHCVSWTDCGHGVTLWPEQMRALADLNLECHIDVESDDEDVTTEDVAKDIVA